MSLLLLLLAVVVPFARGFGGGGLLGRTSITFLRDDDDDDDAVVIPSATAPLSPTSPQTSVDFAVVVVNDIGTATGTATDDTGCTVCTNPTALALAMRMSRICWSEYGDRVMGMQCCCA